MKSALLALPLVLFACAKTSGPDSPAGPGVTPAAPSAAFRDAKALVNDAKVIANYAAYQTEMAPLSKTPLEFFAAAQKNGGGMKAMEDAAKRDPKMIEYTKRNDAAMQKAGITQSEISALTGALTPLVVNLGLVRGADPAKTMPEILKEQQKQLDQAKAQFVQKYGQGALDNVLRSEKELCAAQEAMLQAALGK